MAIVVNSAEQPMRLLSGWFWTTLVVSVVCFIAYAGWHDDRRGMWVVLLVFGGLFGLVALVSVGHTIYSTLEYMRFGRTTLVVEELDVIGGRFQAEVQLPANAVDARFLRCTLNCTRSMWTAQGNHVPSSAWSEAKSFPLRGRRVAIEFDVPPELPPTDLPADALAATRDLGVAYQTASMQQGRWYHDWQLHVHVDLPGTDLRRTFHLDLSAPRARGESGPWGKRRKAGEAA